MSLIIHILKLLEDNRDDEEDEKFVGKAIFWDYGDGRAWELVVEDK